LTSKKCVQTGTNKAAIPYGLNGGDSIEAIACTVSGTVPTFGSSESISGSSVYDYMSACLISADKVFICYADSSGAGQGIDGRVITISGTTITAGAEASIASAPAYYVSCDSIDINRIIVCFKDGGNSNYGTFLTCDINGTTVTIGTEYVFEGTDSCDFISVAGSGIEGKAVVAYSNNTNSRAVQIKATNDIKRAIGIIKETKAAGEACNVSFGKRVSGLTGLTDGAIYYAQDDGTLGTIPTNLRMGVADSTTELILSTGYYE
jgi:hypothetical protein